MADSISLARPGEIRGCRAGLNAQSIILKKNSALSHRRRALVGEGVFGDRDGDRFAEDGERMRRGRGGF